MDYSLLMHKALVRRAVKSLKDAQENNARHLLDTHQHITQKSCDGWVYSWYVFNAVKNAANPIIHPIHHSLESQAEEHIKKEDEINQTILQISLYIDKLLTVYDQCLAYVHEALPPFLHPVLKEFMLGFAKKPETKLLLTEDELKGKEELYALNLLEITGD